MTIIDMMLSPAAADFLADGLISDAEGPCGCAAKVDVWPHLKSLVGLSGSLAVKGLIRQDLTLCCSLRGIEDLAERVARRLPVLIDAAERHHGPYPGPAMVALIAGWGEGRGRFVGYRVRSWTGGAVEELADGAHGEPDLLENWSDVRTLPNLREVFDLQLSYGRGRSGGEVWHYRLEKAGFTVKRIGVLPGREAAAARMERDHAAPPEDFLPAVPPLSRGAPGSTAAIVNGKIRYTPQPGWAGGEDWVPFTVTDGRGKTSSSWLYLTVAPVQPPPTGNEGLAPAFPTAAQSTVVGPVSAANLQTTYNGLSAAQIAAGVTILVTPGTSLGAALTLGKAGTSAKPIVIRVGTKNAAGGIVDPASFPAATITGRVTFSGNYNWLRGFSVGGFTINNGATGNRVNRSKPTSQCDDTGTGSILDWLEYTNMPGVLLQHHPDNGAKQWFDYRCYFHDDVGTVQPNRVFLQCGDNPIGTLVDVAATVRDCHFANPSANMQQALEVKCTNVTVERCSLDGTGRALRFQTRHGTNCKFLALYVKNGWIGFHGRGHLMADCLQAGATPRSWGPYTGRGKS